MHIVHFLTRLLRGGSEENTIETCRWQADAGHRVTLLHGRDSDPYWDHHLPPDVVRIEVPQLVHPVRPLEDLRALAALRRIYRSLDPDVIHTHQSKAGILGRLAAGAVPGALVVHGIHILPFDRVGPAKYAFYRAAEQWVAGATDVFIPVSHAVGRAFVDAGICKADRLSCVRSGMDLARFANPRPPADWRVLLRLAPGAPKPPVVLMMAAFEPRKRHIAFLRAFATIAADVPDMRLLLAGSGPEEAAVRAEIATLGLSRQVILTGHRSDPEALFALADISVLSSEREGLPRVVVQSLAAGCPVLAQDLPGLDEVLVHGHNGWIADARDMAGFVGLLRHFLTEPAQLAALRQGARGTDVRDWALDELGARTTQIYLEALERTAGRRLHPA